MAQVVMVKRGNGMPLMLVLPATHAADFAQFQAVLSACRAGRRGRLSRFPNCKTSAAPLFGNLFGLNMLDDTALTLLLRLAGAYVLLSSLSGLVWCYLSGHLPRLQSLSDEAGVFSKKCAEESDHNRSARHQQRVESR
jgi:hypothetical protein